MEAKTVSIIVPAFNCEAYLENCITSLLQQTYTPLEIILVDDGSSDGTSQICDMYASKYNRIRIIHKRNEGAAAARKDGILLASGDYLVFVDADDSVEVNHVKYLMQYAEKADLIIGELSRFSEESIESKIKNRFAGFYDRERLEREVFPQMLSATPFYTFGIAPSMCGKLIRRDVARRNIAALETGVTQGEDGCFSYAVLLDCNSVYFAGQCGYHYRIHNTSTSHCFQEKELQDTTKLRDFYRKIEKEKGWDSCNQIEEYIARMCVATTLTAVQSNFLKCKNNKIKIIKYVDENFPSEIWSSAKFQTSPCKRRMLYFMVRYHMFFVLKWYDKILEYKKRTRK